MRAPRSVLVALGAALLLPLFPTTSSAAGDVLRYTFDNGETLASGSPVVDVTGNGHAGKVRTAQGGSIARAAVDGGGFAARYPAPCSASVCPLALIEAPSDAALVMGYTAFEWGTRMKLPAASTNDGQNLVQKGLHDDAAGQWKLQIDGYAGKPSCVVSGSRADGSFERVGVLSDVSVADGRWHNLSCRRNATGVTLYIDGAKHGSTTMRPVRLNGPAPVRIGGKFVNDQDNDEFQGSLDDVFVRRL